MLLRKVFVASESMPRVRDHFKHLRGSERRSSSALRHQPLISVLQMNTIFNKTSVVGTVSAEHMQFEIPQGP